VNATQAIRRAAGFVTRNWPLKLAAIVVATLLYAGLVLSQDSDVVTGRIAIVPENQPDGTVLMNALREVEAIRYIAPADLGRLRPDDFRVTVDLRGVKAEGEPETVRVDVQPLDPRVTIVEVTPRSIQVVLDAYVQRTVPIRVDRGNPPAELDVGETRVDPASATVSGPASVVGRVDHLAASVTIDPSGLDVDREVEPVPVDANGEVLTGIDVEPSSVRVTIPVFVDRQSRTVPVNPVLNGTPAPGFRIAAIEVDPQVVLVLGDADQLRELVVADTAPVQVFGATSDVSVEVDLALPAGLTASAAGPIAVVVRIEAVTDTRSYQAGLRLDGASPDLRYEVSTDRVLVTLFGATSELDRLSAVPLVLGLNVGALGPGTHAVAVTPSLPAGVTVVALSPPTVTVIVREPVALAPSLAPEPSPSP
jgi:YbbR domain-containing protein